LGCQEDLKEDIWSKEVSNWQEDEENDTIKSFVVSNASQEALVSSEAN
jgi:hypothetical protein